MYSVPNAFLQLTTDEIGLKRVHDEKSFMYDLDMSLES